MTDCCYRVEVLATPEGCWAEHQDYYMHAEAARAEARRVIELGGAAAARVIQVTEQEVWRGLADRRPWHQTEVVPAVDYARVFGGQEQG